MPPAWRNQRDATGVDTPTSSAASSVRLPCAIKRQTSAPHAGLASAGPPSASPAAKPDPPAADVAPSNTSVITGSRRPIESALHSAVGVVDQPGQVGVLPAALPDGLFQGVEGQVGAQAGARAPADDPAGEPADDPAGEKSVTKAT
jgi:hypothetical protein